MKYLLDTNICIYIINRRPEKVYRRFREHAIGDVGISAITVSELQYGVSKSSNPSQNQIALSQFLAPLEIDDYPSSAAEHYGNIRAQLERKGKPIGANDLLISAHALALDATLVTNNIREFRRITALRVENWTR